MHYDLNREYNTFVLQYMNYSKRLLYTFLPLLFISLNQSFAQSPTSLIAQPYNSIELTNLRAKFDTLNPIREAMIPALRVYQEEYTAEGITMQYNRDFALIRISLYDSGYNYKAYQHELPKKTQWGMTLEQVQKRTGLLDIDEVNIYVRRYVTEDDITDFYFTDGKLDHIKITATVVSLEKNLAYVMKSSGARLLPDGKRREGNVVDGFGTMTWADGASMYKGQWSYGLPHGAGQYVDTFGNKYEGEFKLGFIWGQGKFFSVAYNYSYTGQYVMSKKHGTGLIIYDNGIAYDGDWVQDSMKGTGTYFLGKNYFYAGQMNNNSFNGEGTLTSRDGVIAGPFKEGKPHGVCTQTSADASLKLIGNFSNGKKNGTFEVESSGDKRTTEYQNDVEVGLGNRSSN